MPFQRVENAVQAELILSAFGVTYENVLTFGRTTGDADITTGECVTVLGAVQAWAEDTLMPVISTDVTLDSIEVKGLDLEAPAFAGGFSGISGGELQASEPLSVTCCVSFRSGFSGRNFRGRNYVSGLPVGDVLGNTINTSFTDDLLAAYNALLTAEPTGFNWVVVSRYTDNLLRPFGVFTAIQSVAITSNKVTTMKSRIR